MTGGAMAGGGHHEVRVGETVPASRDQWPPTAGSAAAWQHGVAVAAW